MSLERIAVVGDSCSGKTTLARALNARLGHPHIELDELHWGPSWTPRPESDFRTDVEIATSGSRWIADGNYRRVIDLVWSRATDLVWLDYSLTLVFARGLIRSIRRSFSGEPLWAGNRESLRRTFLSRDSLPLWILTSHRARRSRYHALLEQRRYPNLELHWLTSPKHTAAWLASISQEHPKN